MPVLLSNAPGFETVASIFPLLSCFLHFAKKFHISEQDRITGLYDIFMLVPGFGFVKVFQVWS